MLHISQAKLLERVNQCAGQLVDEKGYVSPVDLLVRMERISSAQVEDWRRGRLPYLERVTQGSLGKMNTILVALREFAKAADLKPSLTVYMSWGKGPKRRLRFSKSGAEHLETMYSTHYVLKREKTPGISSPTPDRLDEGRKGSPSDT